MKISSFDKPYHFYTGSGILPELENYVKGIELHKNAFVVIDRNVFENHREYLLKALEPVFGRMETEVIAAEEKIKSHEGLRRIYRKLIDKQFGRDTVLVAVGGGITGDLTGFAAASYMRGVQLLHVPTTLLAAVDSSIGGKTGINFYNRKNNIGAFHNPEMVIADTDFLKTLPVDEMYTGMGEIVKYSFLTDIEFYDFVNENFDAFFNGDSELIEELIYRSAAVKAEVVKQDPEEKSLRKILNYGHTFAHAIESITEYKISHGKAVGAGIIAALYLTHKLGLISGSVQKKLIKLPQKMTYPEMLQDIDVEKAYNIMLNDKKNRDGRIMFVLAKAPGDIVIDITADKKEVIHSFRQMQKSLK